MTNPYESPKADQTSEGVGGLTAHRGNLLLILGILGIAVCPIIGIAAWRMAATDIEAMEAGRMDPTGREYTRAGLILGKVSVGLIFLNILVIAIAIGAQGF